MTIYVCSKCGKFYNSAVLSNCPFCGTPAGSRLEAPKYARHIWSRETLPVDSVAFLTLNNQYIISDRANKGEDPQLRLSWINYPREKRVQLRFSLAWTRAHAEQPSYYVKPPDQWLEKAWIILPPASAEQLAQLVQTLQRNPQKLENWM